MTLKPGQIGKVSVASTKAGYRARVRYRNIDGQLSQVDITRETESVAHDDAAATAKRRARTRSGYSENMTTSELADKFLQNLESRGTSPDLMRAYRENLAVVDKKMGHLPMAFVNTPRIRRAMQAPMDDNVFVTLSRLMGHAVTVGLLDFNPVECIQKPRHVSPTLVQTGGWTVYRLFNQRDELLYVGITNRGTQRLREHEKDKWWWPEVARVAIEHVSDEAEAHRAECVAIREENPLFNRVAGYELREAV